MKRFYASAAATSSIQCRTGVAVGCCKWVRQPMFAVAMACGVPSSSAASLRARSSLAIADYSNE